MCHSVILAQINPLHFWRCCDAQKHLPGSPDVDVFASHGHGETTMWWLQINPFD